MNRMWWQMAEWQSIFLFFYRLSSHSVIIVFVFYYYFPNQSRLPNSKSKKNYYNFQFDRTIWMNEWIFHWMDIDFFSFHFISLNSFLFAVFTPKNQKKRRSEISWEIVNHHPFFFTIQYLKHFFADRWLICQLCWNSYSVCRCGVVWILDSISLLLLSSHKHRDRLKKVK